MPDGSKPSPEVRVGVPEDIDAVMTIARMAAAEGAFMDYEEGFALREIYDSLSLDRGIMGVIGPVGGPLEGVALLRIGAAWYSRDRLLEERSIFVHPDYRNASGGRASKLIEFCKRVSVRMQLPLFIGVLSGKRTEAKVRAYRRHFGEPAGAFWIWKPPAGEAAVEDTTDAPPKPAGNPE